MKNISDTIFHEMYQRNYIENTSLNIDYFIINIEFL